MYKGAITSKIKHAIKLKTSPARLAQLLQPLLAFCFSLQPMTAYRPGLDIIGWKLKQNANEGCDSCASLTGLVLFFNACFITCDHSLTNTLPSHLCGFYPLLYACRAAIIT